MCEVKEVKVRAASITINDTEYLGTEWYNGEGIDFTLSDEKAVNLHMDEIRAITKIAFKFGFLEVY